ncbi:MAG TPA: 4-hydroxy-tetrahydrodipicolinate synthase [Candidatus Acidoferrum sp.]
MQFTGCGTALVTPFQQDFSLDEAALRKLVQRQLNVGVDFLVPCGTTGENPTLTRREHLRVVEITLEESAGQIPVLAGAGGYNTHEVAELARELESLGASGLLSVTPYYNKPTQEGLYQHYCEIARSTRLPIVLYNVPGRCGTNLEPSTVERLAAIENIVGIKEASGNISQMSALANAVPNEFTILSGDDAITLPLFALGGRGVISVAANEIPAEMAQLCRHGLRGEFDQARAIHRKYLPLMEINFIESNPIPVKAALALMDLLEPVWRLPMVPPRVENRMRIHSVLDSLELVERSSVAVASIPH